MRGSGRWRSGGDLPLTRSHGAKPCSSRAPPGALELPEMDEGEVGFAPTREGGADALRKTRTRLAAASSPAGRQRVGRWGGVRNSETEGRGNSETADVGAGADDGANENDGSRRFASHKTPESVSISGGESKIRNGLSIGRGTGSANSEALALTDSRRASLGSTWNAGESRTSRPGRSSKTAAARSARMSMHSAGWTECVTSELGSSSRRSQTQCQRSARTNGQNMCSKGGHLRLSRSGVMWIARATCEMRNEGMGNQMRNGHRPLSCASLLLLVWIGMNLFVVSSVNSMRIRTSRGGSEKRHRSQSSNLCEAFLVERLLGARTDGSLR